MPNLPISGLPQSTDLTGAEILPLVQSSTTKKGTAQDIRNIESALTASSLYVSGNSRSGLLSVSASAEIGENLVVTGSFTSSLQEGYIWVGDSNNRTEAVPFNQSSGSNEDNLGGTATRTLYTRNSAVSFTSGSNVDFMSGSAGHTWGSRELPSSFLLNTNFVSKVIHFRTIGAFGSAEGINNFNCYIQIGDDKLDSSDVGNVALSQPDNHPFEIVGELIFTGGECSVCYSLAHCANNGDLKRYPLSDISSPDTVTGFSGGDIKLIINGSNVNPMTSYTSYIQIYN